MEAQIADPASHHLAGGGFRNSDPAAVPNSFGDLLRWQWQRLRSDTPPGPAQPAPRVAPDLAFVHANATAGTAMVPAITWIGHAAMLVQASGLNVLTDPVFSERASPVQWAGPKRFVAPGIELADLPHIDVVVISHSHYDHLDRGSVESLARQTGGSPLFLVPLGLKAWMAQLGIVRVQELDWWQSHRVGTVEFFLTPVQHWSARTPWDRNRTLWGGWAVFGPDFQWYFAGDTGYSADFARTREHFAARQDAAHGGGFDIALIPIGAYEPRWFMRRQHVDPDDAVHIHRDVGAKRSVGVHWGTFKLTDEPLDQPPRDLAVARRQQQIADEDFFVLAVGQTRRLPPRPPATSS
jgi:N-acyl-phosphatidylethanolamine-hydrolysing phospholipase D